MLGLVVAIGAFFTGPSVTAVRTRQGLPAGSAGCVALPSTPACAPDRSAPGCTRTGASCSSPPSAVAAMVLVFWDRPTGKVVVGIALVLLVVLALIEFVSRPPEQPAGPQLQT